MIRVITLLPAAAPADKSVGDSHLCGFFEKQAEGLSISALIYPAERVGVSWRKWFPNKEPEASERLCIIWDSLTVSEPG